MLVVPVLVAASLATAAAVVGVGAGAGVVVAAAAGAGLVFVRGGGVGDSTCGAPNDNRRVFGLGDGINNEDEADDEDDGG